MNKFVSKLVDLFNLRVENPDPKELADIINGFERQVTELKQRIEFDEEQVQQANQRIAELEIEKLGLNNNIVRGVRIKERIEDLIK